MLCGHMHDPNKHVKITGEAAQLALPVRDRGRDRDHGWGWDRGRGRGSRGRGRGRGSVRDEPADRKSVV